MGGKGSGRQRGASKAPALRQTTDQLPGLDIRGLKRDGLITPGQERVCILLSFREPSAALAPGEVRIVDIEAQLDLTWTPCNYGGSRPWFLCPGEGCDRRVAILYGPTAPPLCRLCRGLSYASQRRQAR